MWKHIENNAAIAPNGDVNVHSLDRALNGEGGFGSRAVRGGRGVKDPLVNDLIDTVNELRQLGPELPSSGTAERGAAALAVGSALGLSN